MNLRPHSPAFVERWRALLVELYGYGSDERALLVPGVLQGKTAVYAPLLNYTDLSLAEGQAMQQRLRGRAHQIRVLDPSQETFAPNDTVTMRLDIAGLSVEQVFRDRIPSKCRNQIRKSQKVDLTFRDGADPQAIADFHGVFAQTMHRLGSPVLSRRLFELLAARMEARFLLAYLDGRPVAGLCLLVDQHLAWVPWAGSVVEHRSLCPNHLVYWHAIQQAVQAGAEVFDFGRSGYLSHTFAFKNEWGAKPVRIVSLASQTDDVYAKYSLASSVWKRLPAGLVNRIGPVLCKYLADL
jgi:hypothetical protein